MREVNGEREGGQTSDLYQPRHPGCFCAFSVRGPRPVELSRGYDVLPNGTRLKKNKKPCLYCFYNAPGLCDIPAGHIWRLRVLPIVHFWVGFCQKSITCAAAWQRWYIYIIPLLDSLCTGWKTWWGLMLQHLCVIWDETVWRLQQHLRPDGRVLLLRGPHQPMLTITTPYSNIAILQHTL